MPAIAPIISVILATFFVYITRADKQGVQIVSNQVLVLLRLSFTDHVFLVMDGMLLALGHDRSGRSKRALTHHQYTRSISPVHFLRKVSRSVLFAALLV